MSQQNSNIDTTADKVDAKTDQMIGSGKQTVGDTVGNSDMKAEGATQNAQGHGKETAHNISSMMHRVSDEIEGTFKGVFKALSGHSSSGNKHTEKVGEAAAESENR